MNVRCQAVGWIANLHDTTEILLYNVGMPELSVDQYANTSQLSSTGIVTSTFKLIPLQ